MSALQLLQNFHKSCSLATPDAAAVLQAPDHHPLGFSTQADYGERLELYQQALKTPYREPNVGGFLKKNRDTPYIEMPYAPFETPKFPIDFVPVNQFGIHRGFDVPEVNAYYTPVLGNLLDIAATFATEQEAAAKKGVLSPHYMVKDLVDDYGSHITMKTVMDKEEHLLKEGFHPDTVKAVMDEHHFEKAKRLVSRVRPHNIEDVLRTSFVVSE